MERKEDKFIPPLRLRGGYGELEIGMRKNFVFNKKSFKQRRRDLRKDLTEGEKKLWTKIRRRQVMGYKFQRQYGVGPYILDFYCPVIRFGIELDGGQHAEKSKIEYDEKREKYLKKFNSTLLRFWNDEVLKNIEGVLLKIIKTITPPNLPLN